MSKGIQICIAVLVIILALSVTGVVYQMNKKQSRFVQIIQNNKILYEIDISDIDYQVYHIETDDGGWNNILIENGRIFVKEANCSDLTCCKMGYLDNFHNPIVCLPHKLVIKYSDENEN